MPITCLREWPREGPALEALHRDWDALLDAADGATVFQSCEWHQAWWQAFGARHRLRLLLLHDDAGVLVAIAPLMLVEARRWGMPVRRLMLVGTTNHASDYADFIVHRKHSAARQLLVDWMAGHPRWTEIDLRNVPESSPTLGLLAASALLAPLVSQCTAEAPTRLLGDRVADRRVANKKSLRRHMNGFLRDGELLWRRLRSAQEIGPHLDPFFDQHVARWAGSASPSPFVDPTQRAFYRSLADRFAANGWLHFSVLLFEGRPIAYHFGFERDGVFTWYKPSFDPQLGSRSPGEVLIKCLLDDSIARDLREFDFTVGSEPFKWRFANEVRRVFRGRVYRRRLERMPARIRERLKHWFGTSIPLRQLPESRSGHGSDSHPA